MTQRAVVFAFWHECLPLMPAVWLRVRRTNPARDAAVLVSRHRDGRFIAAVLGRFGVRSVHGSSARPDRPERGKGGAAGLRALVTILAHGDAVIITPDGPRGPRRQAAGGAVALAALSGAPVLPAAARIRHAIELNTWDRMQIPRPFGRGFAVVLAPIVVPRQGYELASLDLAAALDRAAARAELLCRA